MELSIIFGFALIQSVFQFVDDEVGLSKEVVIVKAEMKPLVTSTMAKFSKEVSSANFTSGF